MQLLLLGSLALAACGEMADIKDLLALSQAIGAEYESQPNVSLSDRGALTVIFENSKYESLSGAERDQFAREVAEFAYTHYARRDSIAKIRVGFKTVSGGAGFSMSRSEVPYSWPVAQLRPKADTAKPPATR